MLTISQLASFVGVTVRAVRHYHATGLLPEPVRDASGYRRYDAKAAIDLVRIKTLADAGVPLSRVRELLHAGPEQFSVAVDEIDQDIRTRIRELQGHRSRIARLADGDNLVLPPEVVEYLGRLRALGMSERLIEMERDGWILLAAHSPDRVTRWASDKQNALDGPEFLDLFRTFDQAYEWQPDDPRLSHLANATIAFLERMDPVSDEARQEQTVTALDETLNALLGPHMGTASPAWERLTALLEKELGPAS
ncbi:MAG TPA: MerR family transcriptional regulator [Nocardioidaceae bacterium]|nr:MerR family transcriptional regulator [Nocardioidaceae bacterium]